MQINIFQFINEYCQDLVEKVKQEKELIDLSEFAHDAIVHDIEGNAIPVVIVDGQDIPVSDFLTLNRKDFLAIWKTESCPEAYDNYVSALEIMEGEEALSRIRNAILMERERLSKDVELMTEV